MHKPIKGTFTEIINAVADGKGVKLEAKRSPYDKPGTVKASALPKKD